MPDNIDKALNMAVVATNAEKEEKVANKDDRGVNVRVFTVRGSRGNTPGNRYGNPRGKFQWSGARGAGSQCRAGPTQYSRRVDGTYSFQNDSRTPTDAELWTGRRKSNPTDAGHRQAVGEEAMSGLKNDDDRWAPRRPYGIQCFNCGLVGHARRSCPRGQGKDLNGIGRTRQTPSSNPK